MSSVASSRAWQITILIGALLLFFWLSISSLVDDTPTMDEQNHIARGLAYLRTGDPRLSMEHPPLINSWSALPVLSVNDIKLPTDDASWQRQPESTFWYVFANKLFWEYNPELVDRIVFLARVPIVWMTMFLCLIAFRFASALWHSWAGVVTFLLIINDPNVIAHGRYSTTDIGGSAMLLLAIFALWRLWCEKTWWSRDALKRLLIAASALSLAFASKLSTLGFVPVLLLVAVLPLFGHRPWRFENALRRAVHYLVAGALSIVGVWIIFGFEWGSFLFVGDQLKFLNDLQGPMPTFWAGIERIGFAAGGGRQAYLLGRFSDDGFRAYFPVAFLVKTPLFGLWMIISGAIYLLWRKETRSKVAFLLVPTVAYFLISAGGGLNIGYRHLLPILPLLYVIAGGIAPRQVREDGTLTPRAYVVAVVIAGSLVTNLTTYPHYVSYFNTIGGGSVNGGNILADSNVDWGQDLNRLRNWMIQNDVEQVKLSYFGSADPAHYVNYEPLPGEPRHRDLWWDVPFNRDSPEPGVYVISVHNLREMPLRVEEKTVFAYFRGREPDARIGGSINIYIIAGE